MADYCTTAEVKALAGATLTTDDALIAVLITRASAMIDRYTDRTFAERTETRYFTPGVDTTCDANGNDLLLTDEDLLSVTTLTNGDGEVIPPAGYLLYPLNRSPKYGVLLKSGYGWECSTADAGTIIVAGSWGYCTAATRPADVTQAAARLALWLYRQREAPFNRIGNSITGEYEVPTALPDDIKAMLKRYEKPVWGGV